MRYWYQSLTAVPRFSLVLQFLVSLDIRWGWFTYWAFPEKNCTPSPPPYFEDTWILLWPLSGISENFPFSYIDPLEFHVFFSNFGKPPWNWIYSIVVLKDKEEYYKFFQLKEEQFSHILKSTCSVFTTGIISNKNKTCSRRMLGKYSYLNTNFTFHYRQLLTSINALTHNPSPMQLVTWKFSWMT